MSDTTSGAGLPPHDHDHDQGWDGADDDPSQPSNPSGDLGDAGVWMRQFGWGIADEPTDTLTDNRTDIRTDTRTDLARRYANRAPARQRPEYALTPRAHAERAASSNPTPTTMRMSLATPIGGPGARTLQRQQQERNAMAALLNAVRPRGIASPPNVANLARWSRAWVYTLFGGEMRRRKSDYGLRITLDPYLPGNILALLWPSAQRIVLNPALFDPRDVTAIKTELPKPSHMPTSLDRIIEASPLLRMVIALCWIRWYSWDDLTATVMRHHPDRLSNDSRLRKSLWGPLSAQAIGFAPAANQRAFYAPQPHDWERYHADYYNDLWARLLDLLVMPEQLTAQAEVMLMRRNLPPTWGARRQIVDEMACADGLDVRHAEQQFIAELAARSRVATPLVRARIDRPHTIRTLEDYQRLSNDLIQASPELRNWRRRAADDWRCNPGDLALWLMEPFARLVSA